MLRFRAPGKPLALEALLVRAAGPGGDAARRVLGALRGGNVRVDGRTERDAARQVEPGARVSVTLPESGGEAAQAWLRHRGADFAVFETAPSASALPLTALAVMLGVDPATLSFVVAGDAAAHALSLVAFGDAARERLVAALEAGNAREERVLIEALPWVQGVLEAGSGSGLRFAQETLRDGVAECVLDPGALGTDALRAVLATTGAAILGDARHGGRMVAGGLRLWSASLRIPGEGVDISCEAPKERWPEEPVFPAEAGRGGRGGDEALLAVSQSTLRAVSRGHPWVLTDSETGDAGRFRAGSLVVLTGPREERGGLARIEGDGPLAARLWSPRSAVREAESVEARVAAALARRRALLDSAEAPTGSDAYRLVHGEADGLPGLAIDRLGGCLRVLVTGRACTQLLARTVDATVRALAPVLGTDPPVVEVLHLREKPAGSLESVRLLRGSLAGLPTDSDGHLLVRERGLRFAVDLGLAEPARPAPTFGLFLDQRDNRGRLARRAASGRWLNLFAHTGAFSVALLAAGAAEVVSVDLSPTWLRWIDEAVTRNGLEPSRSRTVRSDSRRWLERLAQEERFDGIVLDPPTAAAAGRRFWSVRRDLEPLVETALARLRPGGCLFVSRNDRAGHRELPALVRRAATRGGVVLADVQPALPGEDFPGLAGFPEGDPFEAVEVLLAGEA